MWNNPNAQGAAGDLEAAEEVMGEADTVAVAEDLEVAEVVMAAGADTVAAEDLEVAEAHGEITGAAGEEGNLPSIFFFIIIFYSRGYNIV